MIEKWNGYIVECDECDERLKDGDGNYIIFDGREEVQNGLENDEWIEKDGKVFCCDECEEKSKKG